MAIHPIQHPIYSMKISELALEVLLVVMGTSRCKRVFALMNLICAFLKKMLNVCLLLGNKDAERKQSRI
jgi:hypothetical protein